MSFLERQKKTFAAELGSVAAKIGGPKRPPPPSPTPSVASTNSAVVGAVGGGALETTPTKKPKRDPGGVIYSQPGNTGVGEELGSNILYIVEYLKKEGKPKTLHEILSHTNLNHREDSFKRTIKDRLLHHTRVNYIEDKEAEAAAPKGQAYLAGRFEFLPIIPGVKSKTALVNYLQKRPDASAVLVKDLKDGWPDCEEAIAQLEAAHQVLVVRTKKDGLARTVWIDDPSLFNPVDAEFKNSWVKTEVPAPDDIVRRLIQVGQKPTSEDPRLKVQAAGIDKKKQKKRVQRRNLKMTNTHMEHLLKDYSHLRK